MDFTYLQTFCAVAKWGSFTRTAEELGYAQSSVTTQIQKLEEQYGAILFERFGRKMQLTQAGQALLPYAQQILALQSEAKLVLAQQKIGTITIGTIETLAAFYLPPILQAFRLAYPFVKVQMQFGNEASIVQAVKAGICDLGLILDRLEPDSQLKCLPLRQEELTIVAQPDSPYHNLPEISVEQLHEAQFILTEEGCTYRALLLEALQQMRIKHQIVGEFGSLMAIKQYVMNNLGIAFLPRITVQEEVAQGKLAAIPLKYTNNLYTQVIYHEKKWQFKAFQDLVALMARGSWD